MPAPWIPFSPGSGWALGPDLGYRHEAQEDDELTSAMPATAIADITQTYKRSGICHCETCRRAASAPTLPFAVFPSARFAFSLGRPSEYKSSSRVTRTFCGRCGSPLTYRTADAPDRVDVMICSLDDPGSVVPSFRVWVSEKVAWDHVGGELPRFPMSRAAGLEEA